MTSHLIQKPLIFQNENSEILRKKAIIPCKPNGSGTVTKKGGLGFGSRKALNDITNKSSSNQEALSKKKNFQKQDFNIAEEAFLHDHKKCIKAQQAMKTTFSLDLVLPGLDSVSTSECPLPEEEKVVSECLDLMELEDLPMSEFSTQRKSPPCSPIRRDSVSPPSSPVAWKDVEFVLKEEADENDFVVYEI